jgi:transketolase
MIAVKKSSIRLWSKIGSRAAFGMGILELAKSGRDFYALSADLGNSSGLARFREEFPDKFINMGIAEQNMIGVAAGLAKDGTPVFVTSFAPFISFRAGEQIRMNLGYMNLNIKAVGLGSGVVMAHLGDSHYGLEDVAVLRAIPNMLIVSPADCTSIIKAVEKLVDYDGPAYLRLTGGTDNPIVYKEDFEFTLGKANVLRQGDDIAIIAAGTMVHKALQAAELLAQKGIEAAVADMHTIKPLDKACLDKFLQHKLLVTVEEHTVCGGLGSAVAEYLAAKRNKPPQLIIGIEDFFPHAGDYNYLLEQCGLSEKQIAEKILRQILKGSC